MDMIIDTHQDVCGARSMCAGPLIASSMYFAHKASYVDHFLGIGLGMYV